MKLTRESRKLVLRQILSQTYEMHVAAARLLHNDPQTWHKAGDRVFTLPSLRRTGRSSLK